MNDTDFVTWLSELRPTVAACMDWLQNAINRFVGSVLKLNLIYLILLIGAFGFAAIYVVRFISNIKMSKGSYESGYTNGSYSSGLSPRFRNVSFLRSFTGRGKLNVANPDGKDSGANYSSINGIKYQSFGSMSSKFGGSSKGGKYGGKNSSGGYGGNSSLNNDFGGPLANGGINKWSKSYSNMKKNWKAIKGVYTWMKEHGGDSRTAEQYGFKPDVKSPSDESMKNFASSPAGVNVKSSTINGVNIDINNDD